MAWAALITAPPHKARSGYRLVIQDACRAREAICLGGAAKGHQHHRGTKERRLVGQGRSAIYACSGQCVAASVIT